MKTKVRIMTILRILAIFCLAQSDTKHNAITAQCQRYSWLVQGLQERQNFAYIFFIVISDYAKIAHSSSAEIAEKLQKDQQ
jgi:hypothetical protein